jgi:hypothetical protein
MIFKQFDKTDIVAGRTQPVSTGMWSAGETTWGFGSTSFYTSSRQTTPSSSQFEPLNGLYYTNVYDKPTGSVDSEVYFSIAYGNVNGSGSSTFDTSSSQGSLLYPTKAIYNQYRNLLLTPGDSKFTFAVSSNASVVTTVDSDEIYVISFRGSKVKDRLDPGQFQMTLRGASTLNIIDDSRDNLDITAQTGGRRYNLIRGTLSGGSETTGKYEAIGLMYPDLGLIVLNAATLASSSFVGPVDGKSLSFKAYNWNGEFAKMQNLLFTAVKNGSTISGMTARVTEYVPARHFFVRVKNQEYNYSNNPTFVISKDDATNPQDIGKLRFSDFYTNPKVYITSVGLYNENNDLVAVAKLSQPLLKDFTNECLIKIKIDT